MTTNLNNNTVVNNLESTEPLFSNNVKEQLDEVPVIILYCHYLVMSIQYSHFGMGEKCGHDDYCYIGEATEKIFDAIRFVETVEKHLDNWDATQELYDDIVNDAVISLSHKFQLTEKFEVYQLKWALNRCIELYHEVGDDRKAIMAKIMAGDFIHEENLSYADYLLADPDSIPTEGISGEWNYLLYDIESDQSNFLNIEDAEDRPAIFNESPKVCALIHMLGRVAAYQQHFTVVDQTSEEAFMEAGDMFDRYTFMGSVLEMIEKYPDDVKLLWSDGYVTAGMMLSNNTFEPFDMSESERYMKFVG